MHILAERKPLKQLQHWIGKHCAREQKDEDPDKYPLDYMHGSSILVCDKVFLRFDEPIQPVLANQHWLNPLGAAQGRFRSIGLLAKMATPEVEANPLSLGMGRHQ